MLLEQIRAMQTHTRLEFDRLEQQRQDDRMAMQQAIRDTVTQTVRTGDQRPPVCTQGTPFRGDLTGHLAR